MIILNLIELLKGKKKQLLDDNKKVTPTVEEVKEPKIEIVIENATNIFKNEEEIILKSAKQFLEIGSVNSLEEGVIVSHIPESMRSEFSVHGKR